MLTVDYFAGGGRARAGSGGVIRIGRVVGVVGRDGILPDVWY